MSSTVPAIYFRSNADDLNAPLTWESGYYAGPQMQFRLGSTHKGQTAVSSFMSRRHDRDRNAVC